MKIINKTKIGKLKAKAFCLCNFSIRDMTIYFLGLCFAEQSISVCIEILVFGETFPHFIDAVFFGVVGFVYFHLSSAMGDILLDLTLGKEYSSADMFLKLSEGAENENQ